MKFGHTLRHAFGQTDEQKIVRAAVAGDGGKVRAILAGGFVASVATAEKGIKSAIAGGQHETAGILIADALSRDSRFGSHILMKAAAGGDTATIEAFARGGFDLRQAYPDPIEEDRIAKRNEGRRPRLRRLDDTTDMPEYRSPLQMAETYGQVMSAITIRNLLPELASKAYIDLAWRLTMRRDIARALYDFVYGDNGYSAQDKMNVLKSASVISMQVARADSRPWELLAPTHHIANDNDRLLRIEMGTLRAKLGAPAPAQP
ncbi:MAG TPA: hypothetical protein VL625_11000 [Patescibacteria group bacterium]|nr:hypothetical protein [Patescibacteria group bacterium]